MGYELCIIKIKEGREYNKRGDSEMLMWDSGMLMWHNVG